MYYFNPRFFALLGVLVSSVSAAPVFVHSKRAEDDVEYEDEEGEEGEDSDENRDPTNQTIALIVVFAIFGILLVSGGSMIAYHFYKKRKFTVVEDEKFEAPSTAGNPEPSEEKHDAPEPRCPWCYISENKLCKWCSGEKTDPVDERRGTTIYSNVVESSRPSSAEDGPMVEGKHSFRPGVGVYTISSPAASYKGKERARQGWSGSGSSSPSSGERLEELVI